MAMTKCAECGHPISTLASSCPSCGAPQGQNAAPPLIANAVPAVGPAPKPSKILRYGGGFLALFFGLSILAAVFDVKTPEKARADREAAAKAAADAVPTDYDRPLQTEVGTLVCPLAALFDRREGHGLKAALDSRSSVFSRLEEAQKAGCDEWREGIAVDLSVKAIQDAKGFQARNQCGMVAFDGGYIYTCGLKNRPSAAP